MPSLMINADYEGSGYCRPPPPPAISLPSDAPLINKNKILLFKYTLSIWGFFPFKFLSKTMIVIHLNNQILSLVM